MTIARPSSGEIIATAWGDAVADALNITSLRGVLAWKLLTAGSANLPAGADTAVAGASLAFDIPAGGSRSVMLGGVVTILHAGAAAAVIVYSSIKVASGEVCRSIQTHAANEYRSHTLLGVANLAAGAQTAQLYVNPAVDVANLAGNVAKSIIFALDLGPAIAVTP